jgi:6-phosphogluconolactonase
MELSLGPERITRIGAFSIQEDEEMRFAVLSRYALSVCVASAVLAACGRSQSPLGVPGAIQGGLARGASHASAVVHFAYVTDEDSNSVSTYAIKAKSGALKQIKRSPFQAGSYPIGVAIDPSGAFAYVADYGKRVSAYSVNATSGALTPVKGSPFKAGLHPVGVAIAPSGTFVYVTNYGANTVSAFLVNASSGALTQIAGSPFAAGVHPTGIAIDPSGAFAFVTNFGSKKFGSNNVSAYAINTSSGALTQVSGSPFATGSGPYWIAVDPTGKFAYVADYDSNDVSAYAINTSSGALKPVKGSPFKAGSEPQGVAIDPGGKFAYVANYGSGDISGYAINASSGILMKVQGSPFKTVPGPQEVAIDPSDDFAFVTNFGSKKYGFSVVSAYAINTSSGALTQVPGSPFKAGDDARGVAIR